ncbi:MAG: hypothetical protein FWG56_10380 [Desulfovibrionaceae bacterium]|jgi:hypothetical protein|nr:hypothetical protein [Desulfovibrionaceae bacterium]
MHPIIQKTLGGLSLPYYLRHFFFGLMMAVLMLYGSTRGGQSMPPLMMLIVVAINTFLYPYSRFVYESVMNFIMGGNIFFVNAILMLFVKIITMLMCWGFALFVAPVGLAWLYYHHSKAGR